MLEALPVIGKPALMLPVCNWVKSQAGSDNAHSPHRLTHWQGSSSRMQTPLRAWLILAVVFLAQLFAVGMTLISFGLYIEPLEAEFNASRTTLNIGIQAMMVGTAVFSALLGKLLDRYEVRYIMLTGTLSLAIGMLGISQSQSLQQMAWFMAGPVALGATAIGPLSAATLITRWFTINRGLALGISTVSTSVGGMIMAPVTAALIDQQGWRQALGLEAMVLVATLVPLVYLVIRNRPEDTDTSIAMTPAADNHPSATLWTVRDLLRDRMYWTITIGIGLLFANSQAFMVSLVPYARSISISAAEAATLIAVITAMGIPGKLVFGRLLDRYPQRRLLLVTAVVVTLFYLQLQLFTPSYELLLLSCAVLGLISVGAFPVWTSILGERYGASSYGLAMGIMSMLMLPLNLMAVFIAGAAYDYSGDYQLAFAGFAAFALVSIGLISMMSQRALHAAR